MALEKRNLPVDGVWHHCPSCQGESGWHVFFKKSTDPRAVHMLLQCPGCKATFDLGLQVSLKQ